LLRNNKPQSKTGWRKTQKYPKFFIETQLSSGLIFNRGPQALDASQLVDQEISQKRNNIFLNLDRN
jgi:hypothetical protein